MPKAIRINKLGGPDVMRWEEVEVGKPGPGEVRVRHTAIGLNFIDVYDRTGLYPLDLPSGLGREAAGVVEAVGRKVRGLKRGDRVAYTYPVAGAYAEMRICPAERLVKVPAGITDEQAAAMMLKGLTAQYLLRQTYRVKRGDTGADSFSGGRRRFDRRAVGAASRCESDRCSRQLGEGEARQAQRLPSRHRRRTRAVAGRGQVADRWRRRARRLRFGRQGYVLRFARQPASTGMMVSFGNSSGPVPAIAPLELGRRGSLFLTRPSLFNYVATRTALERAARELFNVVKRGAVRIRIGQSYPLQDVATAHRDLEARRTTGSTILIP